MVCSYVYGLLSKNSDCDFPAEREAIMSLLIDILMA